MFILMSVSLEATSKYFNLEQTDQISSKMETIINNPGLQHIAEKVFWNLDVEDLKICAQINTTTLGEEIAL